MLLHYSPVWLAAAALGAAITVLILSHPSWGIVFHQKSDSPMGPAAKGQGEPLVVQVCE